jgi:hypothetical protein
MAIPGMTLKRASAIARIMKMSLYSIPQRGRDAD